MILGILLFVLGLVVGSFLNVVIIRTLRGEDFVKGRSHCDYKECGKTIAWYDNIPLFSYLFLRGKCRYCKKAIAIQHPVIELMTGVLFVWWYVVGFAFFHLGSLPFSIVQPLFWLIVGILLWLIFVTDLMHMLMPTMALVVLPPLAFLYRWWLSMSGIMEWRDFWLSVATGIGLMAFLGGIRWLTKGRGMGDGDVYFALSMGILLGWPRGLVGMFVAFLLGASVGAMVMAAGLKKLKSKIAFGPFLILGTIVALVWGEHLWGWYMQFLW